MIPIIRIRNVRAQDWGRNARNTPFDVEIALHLQAGQSWLGVLAQEVYESRFKLCFWNLFKKGWREEMEITSHAIEAWVASRWDGYDFYGYLAREAEVLVAPGTSYAQKGLFKGKTADEVFALLVADEDAAISWTQANGKFLNKWAARRRQEAPHGRL